MAAQPQPLTLHWTDGQGSADNFLDTQLRPEALRAAAAAAGFPIDIRLQVGYDHSYFFIATFIEEHLQLHAKALAVPISD